MTVGVNRTKDRLEKMELTEENARERKYIRKKI